MSANQLTVDEWHEIAGYLIERPQCGIDENGAIWLDSSNHGLTCMHPRMFLDICREPKEQLTVADIRAFKNAGIPLMSEAGFEMLKKQLNGGSMQ